MGSRRLTLYLWVMLAVIVALGVVVIAMPPAGAARAFAVGAARLAAITAAMAFSLGALALKPEGAAGTAWLVLCAGVVAWMGAEALSFYYECYRPGPETYPFLHDVLWAAGYVGIAAALVIKIAKPPTGMNRNVNAVAGAAACAALLLILTVNFIILPALRNPALSGGQKAWDVFYGAADFTLFAGALVLIAIHGGTNLGRPWAHISLGLVLYTTGDFIFLHLREAQLYGPSGNLVTALFWVAGYLLLGFGAYQRRLIFTGAVVYPEPSKPRDGDGPR